MLKLGEQLLHSLALKQLRTGERICVTLSEGRSLYLLHHFFNIKTLNIKNLKWCEVFATLVLKQSATIKSICITEYGDDDLAQALKMQSPSTIQMVREKIIDSLARAECLFDTKVNSSAIAIKGAKSKASNIEPLKLAVIELYLSHYSNLNNKRAGEAIFKHLTNENNKLLFLSYAEEKSLQFSKWIGEFLKGNLKFPIKKQPRNSFA